MVYISRTPREPRRLSNEWDWSCCSSGKPTPSNCGKPLLDCAERVFYFRIYYDRGRVAGRIHPTCFADCPSRTALDLVLLKRERFIWQLATIHFRYWGVHEVVRRGANFNCSGPATNSSFAREGVLPFRGSSAQHRPEYVIPQCCADAVVSRRELVMTSVVLKQ